MIFNSDEINKLEEDVRLRLSGSRYLHTLGVKNAALKIGAFLMPERIDELACAALLHDISKELSYDEHTDLINRFKIKVTDEDLKVKPALHSFSGAAIILRDFPRFASEPILTAVLNHTLGSPDMDLFSEIIFLSDFVEDGRSYESSLVVRDYLFDNLSKENDTEMNVMILHKALVLSIEYTLKYLEESGKSVHSRSLLTKNAFLSLI